MGAGVSRSGKASGGAGSGRQRRMRYPADAQGSYPLNYSGHGDDSWYQGQHQRRVQQRQALQRRRDISWKPHLS